MGKARKGGEAFGGNLPWSKEVEIYNTRAFLFHLVAGQFFVNGSDTRGPAYLLELFRKFKPYAWGPTCLALEEGKWLDTNIIYY